MQQRGGEIINKRVTPGFTIVELLIVVVIIAILAAITIVSFNGIQSRTVETSVKSDINALAKQIEQFRALNGTNPSTTGAGDTPAPELEAVLRGAGLYQSTRVKSIDEQSNTIDVEKSFVFCISPDKSTVYVVSSDPIMKGTSNTAQESAVGKKLFYYSSASSFGETTFRNDLDINRTAANICNSAIQGFDHNTWSQRWSFDVPTQKAQ